jgi:hypothetical protein
MPLEISEIGVHVAVGDAPARVQPSAAPNASSSSGGDALTPARQEEIVQACVKRVLQSLRMLESR